MISKEKALEVVEYSIKNGDDATLLAYNIPMETFNRYKREYKKHYGKNADLLIELQKRYTDEELKSIASGASLLPAQSKQAPLVFSGGEITFGIMGDTHIGSNYTEEGLILQALEEMNRAGCEFLIHSGDLVEGMMNRPGSVYELSHIGYKKQRDASVRIFQEWKKPLYIIGGNHDLSFDIKFGVGMNLVEDFCERIPQAVFLGSSYADMPLINGARIHVFHGNDGASYALSYREQKIIDSMHPSNHPDMLITGHVHKSISFKYQGVHIISSGTLQRQTPFMAGKKLPAHVGWWVVKASITNGHINWIEPRWYDAE